MTVQTVFKIKVIVHKQNQLWVMWYTIAIKTKYMNAWWGAINISLISQVKKRTLLDTYKCNLNVSLDSVYSLLPFKSCKFSLLTRVCEPSGWTASIITVFISSPSMCRVFNGYRPVKPGGSQEGLLSLLWNAPSSPPTPKMTP